MTAPAAPSVTDTVTLTGFDAMTLRGLPVSIRALADQVGDCAEWKRLTKAQNDELLALYSWAKSIADTVERLAAKGSA